MSENKDGLLGQLSERLGLSERQLKSAAQSGDVDAMLKNAEGADAGRVREILGDPEKTKRLLNSPQAQALIKILNNNMNNKK